MVYKWDFYDDIVNMVIRLIMSVIYHNVTPRSCDMKEHGAGAFL